jgi:glyoxylase-like metal-dependent hydrolase (beta-lactamase superfamily II)
VDVAAEVVVLRPGYARVESDGSVRAGGTVSLVVSGEVRIIVDTGGPHEGHLIVEALARHGLRPEQINNVVCTHGHIDHVGNNSLFAGATFFMGEDRSVGDRFETLDLSEGPLTLADGVQIVATPGHTSEDISLLVTTEHDVVAIVGDLFENGEDRDGEGWIRFSRDPPRQRRHRAEILSVADFIVPGHGDVFSTSRR